MSCPPGFTSNIFSLMYLKLGMDKRKGDYYNILGSLYDGWTIDIYHVLEKGLMEEMEIIAKDGMFVVDNGSVKLSAKGLKHLQNFFKSKEMGLI
jgi:hypothetical protein